MVAEISSGPCQPCVVFLLAQFRFVLFRIHFHASELIYIERFAETPYAFLLEYGRPFVFHTHGYVANEKQRGEENKAQAGYKEVNRSFQTSFHRVHAVVYMICFVSHFFFFVLSICPYNGI